MTSINEVGTFFLFAWEGAWWKLAIWIIRKPFSFRKWFSTHFINHEVETKRETVQIRIPSLQFFSLIPFYLLSSIFKMSIRIGRVSYLGHPDCFWLIESHPVHLLLDSFNRAVGLVHLLVHFLLENGIPYLIDNPIIFFYCWIALFEWGFLDTDGEWLGGVYDME